MFIHTPDTVNTADEPHATLLYSRSPELLVYSCLLQKCMKKMDLFQRSVCWTLSCTHCFLPLACMIWYWQGPTLTFDHTCYLRFNSESLPAIIMSHQPWNGILHDFYSCIYHANNLLRIPENCHKNISCFIVLCCFHVVLFYLMCFIIRDSSCL